MVLPVSTFHFVRPLTRRQPKTDELEIATARSHAAKFCQQKRRELNDLKVLLRNNKVDPFDSLPIPLTFTITCALDFRKRLDVTTCHFACRPVWAAGRANAWRPHWTTCEEVFHDDAAELFKPETASAFALYAITIQTQMTKTGHKRQAEISQLQVSTVKSTRNMISQGSLTHVLSAVHWLFAAAVLRADLNEALIHGHAWKNLLRLAGRTQTQVSRSDIINMLFLDSHLSTMFMCDPIFDGRWAEEHLHGSSTAKFTTYFERMRLEYDPSIAPVLQNLVTRFRFSRIAWKSLTLPDADYTSTVTMKWIVADSHIRKGHLLNIYLSNPDNITRSIVISLLSLEMTWGCDPVYDNKRVWPSMQMILQQFYACMRQCTQDQSPAVLWCLFIGAYIEQRESSKAASCWFNNAFATKARQMRAFSWNKIKQVMQTFLYDEFISPAGEAWVDQILQRCCRNTQEHMYIEAPSWISITS